MPSWLPSRGGLAHLCGAPAQAVLGRWNDRRQRGPRSLPLSAPPGDAGRCPGPPQGAPARTAAQNRTHSGSAAPGSSARTPAPHSSNPSLTCTPSSTPRPLYSFWHVCSTSTLCRPPVKNADWSSAPLGCQHSLQTGCSGSLCFHSCHFQGNRRLLLHLAGQKHTPGTELRPESHPNLPQCG